MGVAWALASRGVKVIWAAWFSSLRASEQRIFAGCLRSALTALHQALREVAHCQGLECVLKGLVLCKLGLGVGTVGGNWGS